MEPDTIGVRLQTGVRLQIGEVVLGQHANRKADLLLTAHIARKRRAFDLEPARLVQFKEKTFFGCDGIFFSCILAP